MHNSVPPNTLFSPFLKIQVEFYSYEVVSDASGLVRCLSPELPEHNLWISGISISAI